MRIIEVQGEPPFFYLRDFITHTDQGGLEIQELYNAFTILFGRQIEAFVRGVFIGSRPGQYDAEYRYTLGRWARVLAHNGRGTVLLELDSSTSPQKAPQPSAKPRPRPRQILIWGAREPAPPAAQGQEEGGNQGLVNEIILLPFPLNPDFSNWPQFD